MTPELSDLIPGSLENMDKHIGVADVHQITAKQKGQARIKMYVNNGDPFIAKFHMLQVIFNYYVNIFVTYLFISQRVLHILLWSKREKCGYITT